MEVDVLQSSDLDSELFEKMIKNAKNKQRINPGMKSYTDTGHSLLEICEELGLK